MRVVNQKVLDCIGDKIRNIQLLSLLDTRANRIDKVVKWNELVSYISEIAEIKGTMYISDISEVIKDIDKLDVPF